MQVYGEGGVGVGAGVDGAIVVIILGKHDPLGSGELLFQVTSDSLLLFPSEGSCALACSVLILGLVCSSHGNNESLLLLVRASGGGLSHDIVLLPLGGGGCDGGLLPVDGGEVGVTAGIVSKMVVVGGGEP
jgi:hypothetical protein